MRPETALARLVEDTGAPVGLRVQALRKISHPTLAMLRRLLVEGTDHTAPSRLRAVAALAFAREIELRYHRPRKRKSANGSINALGI